MSTLQPQSYRIAMLTSMSNQEPAISDNNPSAVATGEVERFWVVDATDDTTVTGWFGVVDELLGGVIAYFATEAAAQSYQNFLETHPDQAPIAP